MSRKEPTFSQLYEYITKGQKVADHKYNCYHNLFGNEKADIISEFEQNSDFLAKRKNGNYLYHEVISLTRSSTVSVEEQKKKFLDVVYKYVQSRANGALVFGGLHDEKDNNLHYHLIISANNVGEKKRQWLTKQQFEKQKVQIEQYVLERYPELEQEKLISREKSDNKAKHSKTEGEYKRRTGKPSAKDQARARVEGAIQEAQSLADLENALSEQGFTQYTRGKTVGFLDMMTGKKYRLKTLGLEEQYLSIGKGEEQTKKQEEKSSYGTAEEWMFGRFEAREKQSKQDASAKRYQSAKNQDNARGSQKGDTLKEWVFGDFSARDERHRVDEIRDRFQRDYKSKGDDGLKATDRVKEWTHGDFEEREKQAESEKRKQKRQEANDLKRQQEAEKIAKYQAELDENVDHHSNQEQDKGHSR